MKPSDKSTTPLTLLVFALVLLAINMRSPIVILGSVAPTLKDTLGLTDSMIGWLGSIPMPAFALGSLLSPYLARRLGLERTLVLMVAILTASLGVRVLGDDVQFFIGTAIMSLAIGFVNTLGAPIIKKHAPNHIALLTGILSLCMSVFAGVVAWIALPMTHTFGWKIGMGSWAIIGAITVLIWLIIGQNQQKITITTTAKFNAWNDINAWVLGLFMGIQSMLFYGMAAFLPSIGVATGLELSRAVTLAFNFQIAAPIAIIALTYLVKKGMSIQILAVFATTLNTIGVAGLIYLPHLVQLWSWGIGLGVAAIFTLCLMMFSLRTPNAETARDVSGMVQTVGYSVAFIGPLMLGKLFEIHQNWQLPLTVLLAFTALNIIISYVATRPYMFDNHK